MEVSRDTFLGLCRQAERLCAFSASTAWANIEVIKTFTTVRSKARLGMVFGEDEQHCTAYWTIEGISVPLLMKSTRLHEIGLASHEAPLPR